MIGFSTTEGFSYSQPILQPFRIRNISIFFDYAKNKGADGEILDRISIPTTTPEATLGNAMNFFASKEIQVIGIGTFGPIDVNPQSPTYGSVTRTPKPHWSGYRILEHLKRYFDIPIGFDTDVNATALGEATWGAAAGLNSCLYMTIGTGIGAGAIVEGKLVHGLTHPEMGHILVRRHPDDSYEGHCPFHKDCLEGLAAGPALEDRSGTSQLRAHSFSGENHCRWRRYEPVPLIPAYTRTSW